MTPEEKRLNLLLKHIKNVQSNCEALGRALLERGEPFKDVKDLIKNGQIHDSSKFDGIEWEHLNGWDDPLFPEAIKHHVTTNKHHPEFWGDINVMPRLYVQEMCCDWLSRSSELRGKGLCQWIEEDAMLKYHFNKDSKVYEYIDEALSLLLEPAFA